MEDRLIRRLFEALNKEAHRRPNEGCNARAIKLAEVMARVGRAGKVVKIISVDVLGCLVPTSSNTRNWDFHCVCMEGNKVYDPSVGVPLDKEEYVGYMFPQQRVKFIECSDSLVSEPFDQRSRGAYSRHLDRKP